MPGRRVDVAAVRQKLFNATGGIEAHDQLDRLLRADPSQSIPVLMEYSTQGRIDHVRTSACARLVHLVPDGDSTFAGFFERGLADPAIAYWSVEGLARTARKTSFPALTRFALDSAHRVAERGKAIREMALLSGQHLVQGLPPDPGHWKQSDLPIEKLEAWAADGFPDGPGFALPARHPRLDSPVSPLDHAAGRLDARLAKLRSKTQDPMNPTNWLVPASPSDLAAVEARWKLPSTYLQFLRDFSPMKVVIESRRYYQGLELYGAGDLLRAQDGYSYDPITQKPIEGWRPEHVVIAAHAGDPFVIDLSKATGEDAPVLTAGHDEPPMLVGDQLQAGWQFRKEAASFIAFLERLSK